MTTTDLHRTATLDDVMRGDPRFDGQFFSAVLTTGIFCRPGCPGRPRAENVRFFATAAAAAEAGFRPCLRCHPESAPDAPEWQRTSAIVTRALRLIGEGALDEGSVADLACRLNVSARQLQRLFVDDLGAPPVAVAQTRRLLFAKKLIDETDLSMADIAFSAGYTSVRRFNESIRQTYARTPTQLRRKRRGSAGKPERTSIELKLFYREPYNWPVMLAFLSEHATPRVETVERNVYRRTIRIGDDIGIFSVRPLANQRALLLRVSSNLSRFLLPITERVKQMFDLKADPTAVDENLVSDASLASIVRSQPGVRVPGCWDGFEVAVRGLIAVYEPVRGRELAGSLVEAFADELPETDDPILTHVFPTPSQLAGASLARLGVQEPLSTTIRALSRAVRDGSVRFDGAVSSRDLSAQLTAVPGVDIDVIQYLALRTLGEPDLDLTGNQLLCRRSFEHFERGPSLNPGWRSYAAMYRWAANRTGKPALV